MSSSAAQEDVQIFEVGPRDGLQNEATILSVAQRVAMIERMVEAGAREIEIGSFVHPKWIPQMAATEEVARQLERREGVRYWALVPNLRGLERAMDCGVEHVAVFMSSSQTHSRSNLNRTIEESLAILRETCAVASAANLEIRAYVSTVFGCPFEGAVDFGRVLDLCEQLLDFGAGQISLGDTIGAGHPLQVRAGCERALERFGPERIALHLHDTQGLALTNTFVAWEAGVRAFDSAVGGLGGCPYAPGAAGNLATEDLVNLFDSMGLRSGLSLDAVCQTSRWMRDTLGLGVRSRYFDYWIAKQVGA